jgi:hypothetical protein
MPGPSLDSALARPNVLARTAPRTKAGMRLKRLSFLEDNGDRPWAMMHVLSPSTRKQHRAQEQPSGYNEPRESLT